MDRDRPFSRGRGSVRSGYGPSSRGGPAVRGSRPTAGPSTPGERYSEDHQPNEGLARPRTSGAPVIGVAVVPRVADPPRGGGFRGGRGRDGALPYGRFPSGAGRPDDGRWERGRDQDHGQRRASAFKQWGSSSVGAGTGQIADGPAPPRRPRLSEPSLPATTGASLPPWPKSSTLLSGEGRPEANDRRPDMRASSHQAGPSSGWSRPSSPNQHSTSDRPSSYTTSNFVSEPAPSPQLRTGSSGQGRPPRQSIDPIQPAGQLGGASHQPQTSARVLPNGLPERPLGLAGQFELGPSPIASTSASALAESSVAPIDDERTPPPTDGAILTSASDGYIESSGGAAPRRTGHGTMEGAAPSSTPLGADEDVDVNSDRQSRGSLSPISRALRAQREEPMGRSSPPAGPSLTAQPPSPFRPKAEPHSPDVPTAPSLSPEQEDVKPNLSALPPSPDVAAPPAAPARHATTGVASFSRAEIPASCYGPTAPDRALARKTFVEDVIRRLNNQCKTATNPRWRDDGFCADYVVCLSDGTWNVWYPEDAVGKWGKQEKEAFREDARRDVARSGWEVGKVREWADGRGVEVLWKRKERERRMDRDSIGTNSTVDSGPSRTVGIIDREPRPVASGSGSRAPVDRVDGLDGLGLGTIGEHTTAISGSGSRPVDSPAAPAAPALMPQPAGQPARPAASSTSTIASRPLQLSSLSDTARGKQPERVRTGRSRSPSRTAATLEPSLSRRAETGPTMGASARSIVSAQAARTEPVGSTSAPVSRVPTAPLPAPTSASSRRAGSPPASTRSIPSLANANHPIPIMLPTGAAPRQASSGTAARPPTVTPAPALTPSTLRAEPLALQTPSSLPPKPPTSTASSVPTKKVGPLTRVAEGTSSAWSDARQSPKIGANKAVPAQRPVTSSAAVPVRSSSAGLSGTLAADASPASAPAPTAGPVPAPGAASDGPSSEADDLETLRRENEELKAAQKQAAEEIARLRLGQERAAKEEAPVDVLITGYPADAKEMEVRTFISYTAIQNLSVSVSESWAVVKLRSKHDADETVRLLRDHDFRPGIRVTIVPTGVQRAVPSQPAVSQSGVADPRRASQLPTPPPNVAVDGPRRDEVHQIIDSSSDDDAPVRGRRTSRALPAIGVAGPGPSTAAAAAGSGARKRKVVRPQTVSDSDENADEEPAAAPVRVSTAKRTKPSTGVMTRRPPSDTEGIVTSSSGRFSIPAGGTKAALKARELVGDKTRRMLVEQEHILHASMRGHVSIWDKDECTRAAKAVQLDLCVGNSMEEASVAGDRLIMGLSSSHITAYKKTYQIGWVRLDQLDPHLAPEFGTFDECPHSTAKATNGVTAVVGLPTSVFSEDDVSVFASGGMEHAVRLWHVDEDNWASSEELHHKHKSRVESLLYCKRKSNVLYSAGGSQTFAFDMAHQKMSDVINIPNAEGLQINYVHSGSSADMLILETRRVTNQFKMFDLRRSATQLYDFGTQSSATTTTTKYKKGSYHRGRYFASGEDGVVKIWDMRKLPAPCQEIRLHNPDTEFRQVTFDDGSSRMYDLTKEKLTVREYIKP